MTDIPSGRVQHGETIYWEDGKGLIPESMVKPADKLLDELIREVVGRAVPLQAQIKDFREDTLDKVDAFIALLAQEYGVKRGGANGNLTLTSFDQRLKITVAVAFPIEFGPELQVAKSLVDECLNEWTEGSRDELKAFITRAFQVDAQGKINRGNLLYLLKLNIADHRWQEAMRAIKDSMHVVGSKRYMRIHRRDDAQGDWKAVSIDLASA